MGSYQTTSCKKRWPYFCINLIKYSPTPSFPFSAAALLSEVNSAGRAVITNRVHLCGNAVEAE